jgi:hypothetical protein
LSENAKRGANFDLNLEIQNDFQLVRAGPINKIERGNFVISLERGGIIG